MRDEDVQAASSNITEVDCIETVVCRLTVYRDESKVPWSKLTEAPIRTLLNALPELSVCKDPACDQMCARFHPAVEETVTHLFQDVWGRSFAKVSGSKAKPEEADVFQAQVRAPSSAVEHLFKITTSGLYTEPRAADNSAHPAWSVIWLPGQTLAQAQHMLRTHAKAVALTRLGSKYGLRVREGDEQSLFEALKPGQPFVKLRIQAHYRIHPLPHGSQRQSVAKLVKRWGWQARPLQPDRGDAAGGAWLVGASEEPPALTQTLGDTFILISKVRDIGSGKPPSGHLCHRQDSQANLA